MHAACTKPRRFLGASFLTVLLLTYLSWSGCNSLPAPLFRSRAPVDRAAQEDDIRETVFRYRMDRTKADGPFFLRIDGKDPTDTFMERFKNSTKIVKKATESYFKMDPPPGWVRDRSTDLQGMSFSVGSISWLSPLRVEVSGGMHCGALCGDRGTYLLQNKEGHWVVIEYKVQVIL